ncbi:hypothetical protein ANO11243_031750 [Dothideomycetidae sp. 11243]|nr:hypothetical protein ANO11243_031750 [fungal sp. No.11243]
MPPRISRLNHLLRPTIRSPLPHIRPQYRRPISSTTNDTAKPPQSAIPAAELLSEPTWDPASLLPSAEDIASASSHITPSQLRHLLRLSGLSPPANAAEEREMLATLGGQLYFVRQVQAAAADDTIAGLEPLRSLRDETEEGIKEAEIGSETVKDVLMQEETKGSYYPRPRRKKTAPAAVTADEQWDVFANASRKVGKYFVVERAKS